MMCENIQCTCKQRIVTFKIRTRIYVCTYRGARGVACGLASWWGNGKKTNDM